ncbi:MAG TPA: sodium:proton antiporter NhaD, partial [Catalimonadaceae bacterium]|nr:sodium:proton antiporter NhaD [Catalimonadaceae bacterium]
MIATVVTIFILGYLLIVLEHPIQINKTATALLTGMACWVAIALMEPEMSWGELKEGQTYLEFVSEHLSEHLSGIAEILFFLLGAMTIVEVIDSHHAFRKITNLIQTTRIIPLVWILSFLTFFMSAILDNLTASIVMVSLMRKLIHEPKLRMYIAALVVIAANAGGAWSPIGDVTTTMLWVGGQISSTGVIKELFIPSVINLVVPLSIVSFIVRNEKPKTSLDKNTEERVMGDNMVLFFGLGGLIFVPIFKSYTHLPPYVGMLLVLGVVWTVTELIHKAKTPELKSFYTPSHALAKIDTPSILFFLGILLAVSALETLGILEHFAETLTQLLGNQNLIVFFIGIASAIIDNVPLVAASIAMYDLNTFPMDHEFWIFLAYAGGTGGSIFIIGSAAGVAVMGMEKIDFVWYMKRF